MTRLVEYPLDGGGSILVEVDDGHDGPRRAADTGTPEKMTRTFEETAKSIRPIGEALLAQAKALSPDSVELELGVKLNAKAGIVLASSSAEGNVKITLKWSPGKE